MTQVFQSVHPQSDLADFWARRYEAKDLPELRAAIVAQYGPFPLLFSTAASSRWDGQGAGVVITGVIHMPGGEERTEMPFLGGQVMGYVPAIGHDGTSVLALNKVCTPAWDKHTTPIAAIDPHKGSVPASSTDVPSMAKPE